VKRLYQWLFKRARFFWFDVCGCGTRRTIRTEVTVEREGVTLLVGGAAAVDLDTCPLCGSKLAPAQAEVPEGRLLEGSISPEAGPIDHPP
jgi:hypothetical protein